MESILNYYYGINVSNIKKYNNDYLVDANNSTYLLSELHEEIDELQKIINILNNTDIKYHLLVLTKDNNLFITYDNKNYCLLQIRIPQNEKISIFTFQNTKTTGICNWGEIWSQRIDYYESQVEELIKDESIKYALQYYIGLTEIAIYYLNILKDTYDNNTLNYIISHKTLHSPLNSLNYYNPLNMKIDLEIRDLAEYIKMSYFNEILTDYELLHLLDNLKFTEPMANYLFLRLLYPSYFFNLYDDYIETKKIDSKMIKYIKKSKDYESLLSKIYSRLSQNNKIIIRLWFLKAQHL